MCSFDQFDFTIRIDIIVKTHGVDLINDLKWQTLDQERDYYFATLMYKYVYGLAFLRLCYEIEFACDRHDINTCNSNSLSVVVPKPHLECC